MYSYRVDYKCVEKECVGGDKKCNDEKTKCVIHVRVTMRNVVKKCNGVGDKSVKKCKGVVKSVFKNKKPFDKFHVS